MIKKRKALIDRVTQSVNSPSPFGEGRGEAFKYKDYAVFKIYHTEHERSSNIITGSAKCDLVLRVDHRGHSAQE